MSRGGDRVGERERTACEMGFSGAASTVPLSPGLVAGSSVVGEGVQADKEPATLGRRGKRARPALRTPETETRRKQAQERERAGRGT